MLIIYIYSHIRCTDNGELTCFIVLCINTCLSNGVSRYSITSPFDDVLLVNISTIYG